MTLTSHTVVVFCSTVQERDTWRRKPRPGLATLLQVHGEATDGRLAQETAEGSGEELAATLLCVERKHSDLPQR